MYYRTKTYLAGDWDGDRDAIDKIHEWNGSDYYYLFDFVDVHEFVQARDDSLPCTIKSSLAERMRMCKNFILIVGDHTKNLTKGDCRFCRRYANYGGYYENCYSGMRIDHRSFVAYECSLAARESLKVIVLYNSASVDKRMCPEAVQNMGYHVAMKKWSYNPYLGRYEEKWDYPSVRDVFLK